MATITLDIPEKYNNTLLNKSQLDKLKTYLIEDYLVEIYQDAITKQELENSIYDKELNTKLEEVLWI